MTSSSISQFVLFETGGIQFGLDRRMIGCVGPKNYALRAVKIPDLRKRFGLPGDQLNLIDLSKAPVGRLASSPERDSEVILLNGNTGLALLADKIGKTLKVDTDHLYDLPPAFTGNARACFPKVLRMAGTMALIIDVKGLKFIRSMMHPSAAKYRKRGKSDGTRPHPDRLRQDALVVPLDGNRLEVAIIQRLSHVIGKQVDKVVSRAIADIRERQNINTKRHQCEYSPSRIERDAKKDNGLKRMARG